MICHCLRWKAFFLAIDTELSLNQEVSRIGFHTTAQPRQNKQPLATLGGNWGTTVFASYFHFFQQISGAWLVSSIAAHLGLRTLQLESASVLQRHWDAEGYAAPRSARALQELVLKHRGSKPLRQLDSLFPYEALPFCPSPPKGEGGAKWQSFVKKIKASRSCLWCFGRRSPHRRYICLGCGRTRPSTLHTFGLMVYSLMIVVEQEECMWVRMYAMSC